MWFYFHNNWYLLNIFHYIVSLYDFLFIILINYISILMYFNIGTTALLNNLEKY